MRAASTALTNLLNGQRTFVVADLLTITPVSGAVIRITAADRPLTLGGNVFNAGGGASAPAFTRGMVTAKIGLTAGTIPLTIHADPNRHTLNGVPWPAAVAAGALDGARVLLQRVYLASWTDTNGSNQMLTLYGGRVGDARPTRDGAELVLRPDLELLALPMPRSLYQPTCLHTLYDGGCTLVKSGYTFTKTATAGTAIGVLYCADTYSADYYTFGTVTMTSGTQNGVSRTVKSHATNAGTAVLYVTIPFPAAPAVGDTFTVTAGCDKQQGTCAGKFSNGNHFKGMPYIPVPETAR